MKRAVVLLLASVLIGGLTLGVPARADDAANQCGDNLISATTIITHLRNERNNLEAQAAGLLTQLNNLQKEKAALQEKLKAKEEPKK